jgi:voltage-gated potassium channel
VLLKRLLGRQIKRGAARRRRREIGLLLRRRLAKFAAIFVVVTMVSTTLVWITSRHQRGTPIHSWFDSLWLSIETLSTVGFGDVAPVGWAGRLVTSGFIIFTLVSVGFLLAILNESVLEVKRMEDMGLLGIDLRGHVIVYGFSPVAQTAVQQLIGVDCDVALVCDHVDQIPQARQLFGDRRTFVTSGELTQELLEERVNAREAVTAVLASEDDARNIIAALNVHAHYPDLRIIAAVRSTELRQTLMNSGVTYVTSPFELGGRLVASAAFEPEVAKLVEDLSSSTSSEESFDLQQFSAREFAGQSIAELKRQLEEIDGPMLLARCVPAGDDYKVLPHPPGDQVLDAEDHIIVMCNEDQGERMASRWSLKQGR